MHDIRWIRDHADEFDRALARRGLSEDDRVRFSSSRLIDLDKKRRGAKQKAEAAQARRKQASRQVDALKRSGEEMSAQTLMVEVAHLKADISALEAEEKRAASDLDDVLPWIPNLPLPAPEVPDGTDEHDNVEHHRFGAKREYGFTPKQHFELGEGLRQMDFETAAKLSGARFVVLKNGLARMERALGQFMLDLHTTEHGYTEVAPPLLVNNESMFGTAQLPKFAEDQFPTKILRQKLNPELIVEPLEQFLISALSLGTFEPGERPQVTVNLEMGRQPKDRRPRKKAFEDRLAANLNLLTLSGQDRPKFALNFVKDGQLFQRSVELTMSLLRNAIAHANVSPEISFRAALKTILEKENFESLWLIPTSEVPLTNFVRGSILDEAQLPMRLTALTSCFRAEAGAAGKDMRGMIRQHQFTKVELVSITTPEASKNEHERMLSCAEEVLRRLDLHYRVVTLCAGDMGFASQKTYDIEVWLPGQGMYREISSCSVCGEFQARRMNARYRTKDRAVRPAHTLNGSGVAVGRALIAVMETYQQQDGSIAVPDVLQPYMGGLKTIEHVG